MLKPLLALLAACTPAPADPDSPLLTPTGSEPTDSSPGPTPVPEEEPPAGAWLLETPEVREIALTIGAAELESLRSEPETWVRAHLAVEDLVLADVGVRLKGNGSFRPVDDKPSWKVDLDEFVEDQEIDGLDELVLNNMVSDPSFVRERLAYAVYLELGIPAPRATHVRLTVNGEPYGLYLLFEDADGRFLNRWFEDGDGPLYEMFDTELTPEGVALLDHDGGPDDRTAILGLAEVLADPASRLSVDGAEWLDLGQFTAYFAASAVIAQFDAYPYSFPGDDVFLYVDPTDGKIRFLPHGGDETFADPFRPVDYVFGRLAVRCLEDPVCEERWARQVWKTLDAIEDADLAWQVDRWGRDLREHLLATPDSYTVPEAREALETVGTFLGERRGRLEAMPGLPQEADLFRAGGRTGW